MEAIYREGTRFDDTAEKTVQIDLHAANSNILSMDEMRAERAKQQFNALTQEAFRAVKLIELEKADPEALVRFPSDPVELSHFSGQKMEWLREQHKMGHLGAAPKPIKWEAKRYAA